MQEEVPGSEVVPEVSALVGRRIGHYEVLAPIGKGGMGVVYRALDRRLGREVALKLLAPSRARDPKAQRRFHRELRAVASLNHPNICSLYDVGEFEKLPFLAFELLEGITLRELIATRSCPVDEVVATGRQLADALAAAHAVGVVHRDVKPANVFRCSDGRVKLLDFGVAKQLHDLSLADTEDPTASRSLASLDAVTSTGIVVGTVAYMAPEQLRGESLDGRSDLFSLGAVLYELLTGRRAFLGRTSAAVIEAILMETPPEPLELRPDAPAELQRIVMKALEKDRALRYGNAGDLRADLLRLERDRMLASGGRVTPRRSARLTRWVWPGLSSISAGLAVALGLSVPGSDSGAASAAPTVVVVPVSEGAAEGPSLLGQGLADTLAASLARHPGINVVAPTPMLSGGAGDGGGTERAKRLGVTHVVRSRLGRSRDRLRLSLSLFGVRAEEASWRGVFEAAPVDIQDIQQEAARQVATALIGERATAGDVTRAPPAQPDEAALRAFARAQSLLQRRDVPGNLDQAIERLEDATERAPDFALGWATLATACRHQFGRTGDSSWLLSADRSIARALELDPLHPFIRYARAQLLQVRGELDGAVRELESLLATHPTSDDARRLLGSLLARQGRYPEAIAELQRAVALRPTYWANLQELGLVQFDSGHLAGAAAAFRRVTQLQPDAAWAYQMLGTVYHARGELAAAEEEYLRAIELGADAMAWGNLGVLYYTRGDFGQAADAFAEAVAQAPANAANHRNLGDARAREGREADARQAWAEAARLSEERLRVDPRSAATLADLAVVEAKLGRTEEARRHALRAVELGAGVAEVRYEAAIVHALLEEHDEAVEALAEAVRLGYSPQVAEEDEDLAPIRKHAGYAVALGLKGET